MGSGGTQVAFNGGNQQGWRNQTIDGQWLESIGFQRRVTPVTRIVYWQCGLLTFYKTVQFCGCSLEHITTRGQLSEAIDILIPRHERSQA